MTSVHGCSYADEATKVRWLRLKMQRVCGEDLVLAAAVPDDVFLKNTRRIL